MVEYLSVDFFCSGCTPKWFPFVNVFENTEACIRHPWYFGVGRCLRNLYFYQMPQKWLNLLRLKLTLLVNFVVKFYLLICSQIISEGSRLLEISALTSCMCILTWLVLWEIFVLTRLLCSPPAIERLSGGIFEEVIVTNSILLPEDKCFPQLTVLSMANLVAETIWHVHRDGSVSSIFQ